MVKWLHSLTYLLYTSKTKRSKYYYDKSDLVLILGDISSSNTNKLVQVAKENAQYHLISKVSDLDSVLIKIFQSWHSVRRINSRRVGYGGY